MAYAVKYQIQFLNVDSNSCHVDLLLKDYTGAIEQLEGAADPFLLSYESGDNSIINPIRASECTINFFNNGTTPLSTFYSEDDEAWKIEFYIDQGLVTLMWTGYIVQDDCSEEFLDAPYHVQLKGTDNIGLLKDVPFNEAWLSQIVQDSNIMTYQQAAGSIADGIITLGVGFVTSTLPIVDFAVGNSPYQDLAGFDLGSNDDRWIIKNGTTIKEFHLTGTIEVQFDGFAENYRWLVQKSDTTIYDLVPNQLVNDNVHNVFTFNVTVTLQPGERLFAMGQSEGNFANDKTYFQTIWTIATGEIIETRIMDTFPLLEYIKFSILKTGLELPLQIFSNIFEDTEQDRATNPVAEMFLQTHLFSGMFMNDDGTWKSCYDIIETILFALNATFMQAAGQWQIIRFPEIRNYISYQVPGNQFPAGNFTDPVPVVYSYFLPMGLSGVNYFINADAQRSILRPLKSVDFTFNYEQPKELIRNINLELEGRKLAEYSDTVDGITTLVREYELLYWKPLFLSDPDAPDQIFLRVVFVSPASGLPPEEERERYIVIQGGNFGGPWLESSSFYITKDDRVNISFTFQTRYSNEGDATLNFQFQTDNGTEQYKINWNAGTTLDGSWTTTGGALFQWTAQEDVMNWTTFSVQSLGCPIDGYFSIMLNQADDNFGGETRYKDFVVKYLPSIAGSLKVLGHTHKQRLNPGIKNILDEEILIDDSPKGALNGALFTSAVNVNGDYLTLTKSWHRTGITESRRLGEITTMERQQMQDRPKTKIDCTVKVAAPEFSPISIVTIDTLPGLNFIYGVVEINYMQAVLNTTLWELWTDGEIDPAFNYTFKYNYETT